MRSVELRSRFQDLLSSFPHDRRLPGSKTLCGFFDFWNLDEGKTSMMAYHVLPTGRTPPSDIRFQDLPP